VAHVNGLDFPVGPGGCRRLDPSRDRREAMPGGVISRARLCVCSACDTARRRRVSLAADEHAAWRRAGFIAPISLSYGSGTAARCSRRAAPRAERHQIARDALGRAPSPNKDPLAVLEVRALAELPGATLAMIYGTWTCWTVAR
jgi:hypothetical protein